MKYINFENVHEYKEKIIKEHKELSDTYGEVYFNSTSRKTTPEKILPHIEDNTRNLFKLLCESSKPYHTLCQQLNRVCPAKISFQSTFYHCIMSSYDLAFQFLHLKNLFLSDLLYNEGTIERHDLNIDLLEGVSDNTISARIVRGMKLLDEANLSDWFQFTSSYHPNTSIEDLNSAYSESNLSRRTYNTLLESQVTFLQSLLYGHDYHTDKFFLNKHLCVYGTKNKEPKRRAINHFRNADLLRPDYWHKQDPVLQLELLHILESGDPQRGIFFPGYSPFIMQTPNGCMPLDRLRIITDNTKLSAFDYYFNYKMESIFNLFLGYQLILFYRDNIYESKSQISLNDFCFLAKQSNVLYRFDFFNAFYEKLVEHNSYVQENLPFNRFAPFDYNPDGENTYHPLKQLLSNKSNLLKSTEVEINEWLKIFKELCNDYENYILAICERSVFFQLYSYFNNSCDNSSPKFIFPKLLDLCGQYIESKNDKFIMSQKKTYLETCMISTSPMKLKQTQYSKINNFFEELIKCSNQKSAPLSEYQTIYTKKYDINPNL